MSQRNLMVLLVVGTHAVGCQDNFPVSLVGINRCRADAGMGVNPGEDKRIGIQFLEHLIEIRAVERAISFASQRVDATLSSMLAQRPRKPQGSETECG